MSVELLKHNLERFGVVTVMDATLYDFNTNKALLDLDTLKISNITSEAQMKEIKGGREANLLVAYNWGRTMNVEFQDALLSFAAMEALWGAKINREDIVEHKRVDLALDTLAVTLPVTPVAIQSVFNVTKGVEYTLDGAETPAEDTYKVAAAVITVKDTGAADDDVIRVYYTAEINNPAGDWEPVEALLKSCMFPGTVKFVGKTFLVQESTGKTIECEIVIPKLKLNANFTLTMEAEGDASVFDFSGMVMINKDKEMFIIKALREVEGAC